MASYPSMTRTPELEKEPWLLNEAKDFFERKYATFIKLMHDKSSSPRERNFYIVRLHFAGYSCANVARAVSRAELSPISLTRINNIINRFLQVLSDDEIARYRQYRHAHRKRLTQTYPY